MPKKTEKKVSKPKKELPKKKSLKVEKPVEAKVEPVAEIKAEVVLPEVKKNPFVRVVELNGRKYNEVFNPADGTTKLLPLES